MPTFQGSSVSDIYKISINTDGSIEIQTMGYRVKFFSTCLIDFFIKFWNAITVLMLQYSRHYTYQQIIFGNIEEYSNILNYERNPDINVRKRFFMIKRYHDIAACCHQKRSIMFVILSLVEKQQSNLSRYLIVLYNNSDMNTSHGIIIINWSYSTKNAQTHLRRYRSREIEISTPKLPICDINTLIIGRKQKFLSSMKLNVIGHTEVSSNRADAHAPDS